MKANPSICSSSPYNFFLSSLSFIFRVVQHVHWPNRSWHYSTTRLELCSSCTRWCCTSYADCRCWWGNFLSIAGRFRWSIRRRVCWCLVVLKDGKRKQSLRWKKLQSSHAMLFIKSSSRRHREALTLHFKRNSMKFPILNMSGARESMKLVTFWVTRTFLYQAGSFRQDSSFFLCKLMQSNSVNVSLHISWNDSLITCKQRFFGAKFPALRVDTLTMNFSTLSSRWFAK